MRSRPLLLLTMSVLHIPSHAQGGTRLTAMHAATDHGWSDHRIELESIVITWLSGLN